MLLISPGSLFHKTQPLYPKDVFPNLFTFGIDKQPVSLNLVPYECMELAGIKC